MKFSLDALLDRYAGEGSPNLPSRLLWCGKCRKIRSIRQIESGRCSGHTVYLSDETGWNTFRWLTGL